MARINGGTSGGAGTITGAANVGTGQGNVFRNVTGGTTVNLKTIKQGTNVTITDNADDVTINATSVATPPAGTDTQVQFNDGGSSFGADASLVFDKTNNILSVKSSLNAVEPIVDMYHDTAGGNLTTGDVAGAIDFWSFGDDAAFHRIARVSGDVTGADGKTGGISFQVDTGAGLQQLMFVSPGSVVEILDTVDFITDDGNLNQIIRLKRAATIDFANPFSDAQTGIITMQTAGEALVYGDVCYMNSDGNMSKANATDNTKAPALAICLDALSATDVGRFLIYGVINMDTIDPQWTVGSFVYLAASPGATTNTAPAGTGNMVQILGVAIAPAIAGTPNTSDTLFFNPQLVMVEVL